MTKEERELLFIIAEQLMMSHMPSSSTIKRMETLISTIKGRDPQKQVRKVDRRKRSVR